MNGGAPKPSALAGELQRITELLSEQKEEEKQNVSRVAASGSEVQVGIAWSVRLEGLGIWPISSEQRGRGTFEGHDGYASMHCCPPHSSVVSLASRDGAW